MNVVSARARIDSEEEKVKQWTKNTTKLIITKNIYYFVFGHFFFLSVAHIANEIPMKQYQLL